MPSANQSASMLKLAARFASDGWKLLQGKFRGYARSAVLLRGSKTLRITRPDASSLRSKLEDELNKRQCRDNGRPEPGGPHKDAASAEALPPLNSADRTVMEQILEQTARCNRNNVTRTEAYWQLYRQHPELHWALLAHMVSRNGGWAMGDLRGEFLSKLITPAQSERMFQFLERSNAYIFADAYPQLLLYAESKKRGGGLFRLLPYFHVSAFMTPLWEQFIKDGNPVPLTIGLIVNEQNYIEGRVVQDRTFREELLNTTAFHAYAWLQLTQVLLPYHTAGKAAKAGKAANERLRLAGLVLESFASLEERIGVGKKLYALLFGVPAVLEGVLAFAEATPHTGSRADYWPHLFASLRHEAAHRQPSFPLKLRKGKLASKASPLHSPKLTEAWPDQPIEPPQRYDWFCDKSGLAWLTSVRPPFPLDMTNEALVGLEKLEIAVLAAGVWSKLSPPSAAGRN